MADFINKELRNWNDFEILTVEGDVLMLTRDTAYKAGTRNDIKNPDKTYRAMTDDEYRTKLNAEIHINELAEISKKNNKPPTPDTKKHRFAKDGFTYRTAYFEDYNGDYYRITISIGHNGSVATVYNVGKIKKDSLPNGNIKTISRGSKPGSSSFDNSIAPITENVNTQFSVSEDSEGEQPSSVGTPLRDLALAPTQEDIAPVAKNATTTFEAPIDAVKETTEENSVAENIAPVFEAITPMTEEEANVLIAVEKLQQSTFRLIFVFSTLDNS